MLHVGHPGVKKLDLSTRNVLNESKKEKGEIIEVLEEIMEGCFYNLEVREAKSNLKMDKGFQ